jgi:HK97 gp10 family phage protein
MAALVRFEGMEHLHAQLQNLAKQVEPAKVEPVLMEGAKIIAADARSRAPSGPTGNLKRAIVTMFLPRLGNNPRSALAGVSKQSWKIATHPVISPGKRGGKGGKLSYYAIHVERGTSKMPAHPFLRPAVWANQERVDQMIISRLKSLIESVAK